MFDQLFTKEECKKMIESKLKNGRKESIRQKTLFFDLTSSYHLTQNNIKLSSELLKHQKKYFKAHDEENLLKKSKKSLNSIKNFTIRKQKSFAKEIIVKYSESSAVQSNKMHLSTKMQFLHKQNSLPCVGMYDIGDEMVKKKITKSINFLLSPSKYQSRLLKKNNHCTNLAYNINYNSILPKQKMINLSKQISRRADQIEKVSNKYLDIDEKQSRTQQLMNFSLIMPLENSELQNLFHTTMQKYKIKTSQKEKNYS